MKPKPLKVPYHQEVSERIIAQLEQGNAPWQRPWDSTKGGSMPFNASTGKPYKGINALNLICTPYTDPRWLTYKQAQALGAQVNKGEKSTTIQYWKFPQGSATADPTKPIADNPKKLKPEHDRAQVFFASVFNAEQVSGLPPLDADRKRHEWEGIERAERILLASEANIRHIDGNRAFYSPVDDRITLPMRDQFPTPGAYYATALHELGHWTGHESRLDRSIMNRFGSPDYAKEELRAEISSMMMCEELGLKHDPSQHAEYVRSWIQVLKDDHTEIFRAASQAEKMKDYVLSLEREKEIGSGQKTEAQFPELDSTSTRFGLNRMRSTEHRDKPMQNTFNSSPDLDVAIAEQGAPKVSR